MSKSLPRGIRNNNPLNIRRSSANNWQGMADEQTDNAFCVFSSMFFGFRAALKIIRNYLRYQSSITTPADIVRRWAPPSENNTKAYIERVASLSGVKMDNTIRFGDKHKICKIVRAMAIVENGPSFVHYFPLELISNAYDVV